MALEAEIETWKPFKDALRIDERMLFDEMMDLARERASAGGSAVRYVITEAMFMTLLFQIYRRLRQLEKVLATHTASLDLESTPIFPSLDCVVNDKNIKQH